MTSPDQDGKIFVGQSQKPELLTLAFGNRHGLVTGATGTGKTVTLQTLAEGFSRAGVPVFAADVKGDLSGVAAMGETKDAFVKRAEEMGFAYEPDQFPVVFWDLFGEQGHPIRATVYDMGPLLLTRMLDLNDVQEGVINIAFKIVNEAGAADDPNKGLVDLENLRELLAYLGDNAKAIGARYGNVAPATIGAVQRELLVIENQGGAQFFGKPELDLSHFMARDARGRGRINILAADKLMESPRLYATFLLWLIAELFEQLPEVGDLDRPKLVFFFDEAHLLFNEAPKSLLDKIEQVVRLIRSKGVGVYFVTQNPLDIPDKVLAQLGNRVQHALRAFTPRDQKAVKAAAETFRPNPELDTAQVITELGKGEALVSFLEGNGAPSMVERALIRPPAARVGPVTPEERKAIIAKSPVKGEYEKTETHESLAAVLQKRAPQDDGASGGEEEDEATANGRGRLPQAAPGFLTRVLMGVAAFFSHPAVRQFGRSVAAVVARTATQEAMRRMGMSGTRRRISRNRTFGIAGIAELAGGANGGGAPNLVGDAAELFGERGLFGTAHRTSRPTLGFLSDPAPEPATRSPDPPRSAPRGLFDAPPAPPVEPAPEPPRNLFDAPPEPRADPVLEPPRVTFDAPPAPPVEPAPEPPRVLFDAPLEPRPSPITETPATAAPALPVTEAAPPRRRKSAAKPKTKSQSTEPKPTEPKPTQPKRTRAPRKPRPETPS